MSIERSDDVEVVARRPTVVTALPLKRSARIRLADLLQARVLDVRDPVDHVDVVLTPACSPQLIAALKRKYGGARVVVVELADWEFAIDLPGPVKRILAGGADAYVLADSLDELAHKLQTSAERAASGEHAAVGELQSPTIDELISAFLREPVEYSTRQRARGDPRT